MGGGVLMEHFEMHGSCRILCTFTCMDIFAWLDGV